MTRSTAVPYNLCRTVTLSRRCHNETLSRYVDIMTPLAFLGWHVETSRGFNQWLARATSVSRVWTKVMLTKQRFKDKSRYFAEQRCYGEILFEPLFLSLNRPNKIFFKQHCSLLLNLILWYLVNYTLCMSNNVFLFIY